MTVMFKVMKRTTKSIQKLK